MKIKYLVIFLVFVLAFYYVIFAKMNIAILEIFAYHTETFAKINKENVYFFSQPIDNPSYFMFEIPNSYYVELTGNAKDENNLFFSAIYLDKAGYVKKSDVIPVLNAPKKPYANQINFRVFIPSGIELRNSPNASSPFNIVTTIPYLETNLVYYGNCVGEEVISQKGTDWYYCKFISSNNYYYGYVYSAFCDLLTPILENTEKYEMFLGELFIEEITETEVLPNNEIMLGNELKIVLIIAITLPCLFIIYLLFKPTKLIVDNGKRPQTKIHRLKKSEYYEYDD